MYAVLTEALNAEDEPFGLHRLHDVVNDCVSDGPQQCVDVAMAAVDAWGGGPPADDQTIVVIDRV